MKLDRIISFFVPKDKKFFTLFSQSSENLMATAKVFNQLLSSNAPDKRLQLIKEIADLEHKGDTITHNIFTELSTNFITPFDREDIHYLASSLDDIVDFIHGSAKRMELYKIDEYTSEMIQLADVIERSAIEVHAAVSGLKGMKHIIRVKEAIIRINSLENQADDIFDGAIASLFINETDAVKIIKVKEILANMETATDKCEDVANVIETILIKNS
jgi:predicted phosphate transport protein (TIGR00153 family)